MNEEQMRKAVIDAIVEVAPDVDPAQIAPTSDLSEQLDIDSMDFLGIVTALDERTGIEVPERDYPRLATLDGAVAYLLSMQAAGPRA